MNDAHEERIFELLVLFLELWRLHDMSAATDALTAAVATLQSAVGPVATEFAALKAGPDEAAVTSATSAIEAVSAQLTALTAPPAVAESAPEQPA